MAQLVWFHFQEGSSLSKSETQYQLVWSSNKTIGAVCFRLCIRIDNVEIGQIFTMPMSKYSSDSLSVSIGVHPGNTDKHFIDRIRTIA